MTPIENADLTAANLIALRTQPDALKIITERLKVKQMGPADHIRTKHEVKAFIDSMGDLKQAEVIVERARARRILAQTESIVITERQGAAGNNRFANARELLVSRQKGIQ
jgi:ribosomal protein RSM22 (predicted rRNA methylase)